MQRTILHADLNNFYASVECLYHPELRGVCMAVGGDASQRHGIILAKNQAAKAYGVSTGEALWQARRKCPQLVIVPPHHELYLRFSRLTRRIYRSYTNLVEPFGLDEAWLDVTGRDTDGRSLADTLRRRVREELGLTISVGVANNKAFAKLASDMKKPDATTVITRENFRQVVWPLPVGDLLYVGPATVRKLQTCGIYTIGDLARLPAGLAHSLLGKSGDMLHSYANGLDASPVAPADAADPCLSIGNSTTPPRDLRTPEDVRIILFLLCEEVAARMREHGLYCRTVQIQIRDAALCTIERQGKLPRPSHLSGELAAKALELFSRHYTWQRPIRSLGVRGCDMTGAPADAQLSLFDDETRRLRMENLEKTLDGIRSRFGGASIRRAVQLQDPTLRGVLRQGASDSLLRPDTAFNQGMPPPQWRDAPKL